ncbi:MAG TPA: type II toxin-antitoxin system RelE/ParE family toxin [Xanthobacteraceae bacterium]
MADDSLSAAHAMIAGIEAKVMRLEIPQLTHMGRPGLVEGTRELIEAPYIIVYKVFEDRSEIVVLSVVHGARDRNQNPSS